MYLEQTTNGELSSWTCQNRELISFTFHSILCTISTYRRYDSFVNWDFYPCMQLPILVYFKETQTPKVRAQIETHLIYFGMFVIHDVVTKIFAQEMQIKGSLGGRQMDRRDNGQMHWFPAFGNARQIREQFEAHGCAKIGTVSGEEYGNLKQP